MVRYTDNMTTVLIPGRHLITTAFMERYLTLLLTNGLAEVEQVGTWTGDTTIDHLIIPITSANQHGSRYNPVPLYARVIGLERMLSTYRERFGVRISYVPIPHVVHSDNFPALTLKYIASQIGKDSTPNDSVVWCSTPALIADYQQHGFVVLPAEYDFSKQVYAELPPNDILSALAETSDYRTSEGYRLLSHATQTLWEDMPEIPSHIFRLWNDPLLTESGSLTEERNYSTYAIGMGHDALLDLKFSDIKDAIVEGKIVDEGCADGALMVRLAKTFPDSDIIGIDITGEFVSRVEERRRAGEFGNSFVHVYQRNILEPVFQPNSINTTICNSTLHELWSYGDRAESVRDYLQAKYQQLTPGGRLVIRDVVGPEDKDEEVLVLLRNDDGINVAADNEEALLRADTAALSTESRFFRFAHDFLHQHRLSGKRDVFSQITYTVELIEGASYIKTQMKHIAEYLSRKDYHDNWASEMNEEFAFWDIQEWQYELRRAGFTIVHDNAMSKRFSGSYSNQWIVDNRWAPYATIYKKDERGELCEQPYPVTNMVLVGEKPVL